MLQPSDAQAALDSSIVLFCAATCSQLNVSKSRGFLVQAQPLASASVSALPSINFIRGQQTVKHIGVLLVYDMLAASHQQFTCIYHAISAKVRHWAARGLSLYHLSQASQVQPLGYGASILFSTLSTDQLQLPARLSAYVAALRALHPHCL